MPNPGSWVSGSSQGGCIWIHVPGGRLPDRPGYGLGLVPAVGDHEAFGVGVGTFHVDAPFAASFRLFGAQAAVGVEFSFEVGVVDPALKPVGVAGRVPALFEVGEEHAVASHCDDAEVGAAQPFVGPPPCVFGPRLGVVGIGSGVGALPDVVTVPNVPAVEVYFVKSAFRD